MSELAERCIAATDLGNPSEVIATLLQAASRLEKYEESFERLANWCRAYPLRAFPEPDFKLAATILKENAMTIDAISASNFRHVLTQVAEIIECEPPEAKS